MNTATGSGKRALMVVCRYLGDVLLATPLAASLRRAGYKVDWIVARGTESILEAQDCADQVFTVSANTPWKQQFSLGRKLWRKYDMAFALPSTDRSMLLSLAASSRVNALITADRSQEAWKRLLASEWHDYTPGSHMVALAAGLADSANLPPCRDVQLAWSDADCAAVFAALPWPEDTPYLHLHPFARWPYKWWRKSAWHNLMRLAVEEGLRVVITGAPAEAEAARQMAEGLPGDTVHMAAGRFSWRQLACLSQHAAAYVGLDTANTHVAAASGANVVALFGPTDPRIWGPWPNGFDGATPWQAASIDGIQRQGNISLLQGLQGCVPCQLEGCDRRPDSISLCLKDMRSAWVWQEVMLRMQVGGNTPPAAQQTAV